MAKNTRRHAQKRLKLTVPEYAEQLGVSVEKVHHFIKHGELRAINAATKHYGTRPRYLIDVRDIELFEKHRQVVPVGELSTVQRLRRKRVAGVPEIF